MFSDRPASLGSVLSPSLVFRRMVAWKATLEPVVEPLTLLDLEDFGIVTIDTDRHSIKEGDCCIWIEKSV